MFQISGAPHSNMTSNRPSAELALQLTCPCGAVGPDELQDALAEGWRDVVPDSSSTGSCSGICPDCR